MTADNQPTLSNALVSPKGRANESGVFWVVIGASAGGLEALKDLLAGLQSLNNTIVLIAQHLDPKHPTILRDLLSRITDIPVKLVEDATRPEPGVIYIVSPGHNALVKDGEIILKPAAAIGPKPSINLLLTSLAEDIGEKSIAIILSGTGSDGAQGIMAVKSANGLVLAQDETTAKYSGMPRAAIDTGFVDLILQPKEIAIEMLSYIESAGQAMRRLSSPKVRTSLEKIFQRILEQTGYDFSGYKLKTIQRRIARRMAVHKVVTIDDYLTLLSSSAIEVESLFKDLLISVTSFFRDTEAFQDLNLVIEKIVENNEEGNQIRVWVPGCANGEEAYSIAILFQQACLKFSKEASFQIFATDIDEFALSLARRGAYSSGQVKDIPEPLLKQYFVAKDDQYWVSKYIRDRVVFARQNVIMDPPFSRLDLVSCRNLLIYFSLELQRQVFQVFHFALKQNGYLFLGKSESASNTVPELFEGYLKQSQIFIRKKTNLSPRLDQVSSAISLAQTRQKSPSHTGLIQEKNLVVEQLDKILLDQLFPTAIVLDGSGQVLHIRGKVEAYLSFPQGKIDTNILSLIREDLKVDVRALLQKARREGYAATQALFYESKVASQALFLAIKRIDIEPQSPDTFVLTFTQVDLSEAFISGTGLLNEGSELANDNLRKEVAVFKERLQTSIEELETTNEEMQSTNEELQSANEELQSANEELQTANEELQSTNEELSTVNQELEVKSYELEQVNNDLEHILSHMDEKVILVDNRLRLLRFTKKAGETFGINGGDLGQTVTTLGLSVDVPNLRQELLNVIEGEKERQIRLRKKDKVYYLRLLPYKSQMSQIVGVMMFFDLPWAHKNDGLNVDGHLNFQLLGDYLPIGLVVIDGLGNITYVNNKVQEFLGFSSEALVYKSVNILMPEPYSQHHNLYLENYQNDKPAGIVGQWREVTALNAAGQRILTKLRIEETWINAQRHFIGFMGNQQMVDEFEARKS
ncbi:CheR family methyltransferase [Thiosulfativibrio zosterae]|uniref:protein-glutamate O-methyltransferase n=1 Tax=Thiosulfativibrio zosterae TaxID=2675053 RepID=A0A6F8PPW3_9GAMM|nr:CheR family methyltransferase [Thiosulfativibrio zosterae]BBP44145.1 chemotaxis protein CheR [Thiosulfativibrio zosterae]